MLIFFSFSSTQYKSELNNQKEDGRKPVWSNLKPNNARRIRLRILVVHNSKAQVVVDKILLLFALQTKNLQSI